MATITVNGDGFETTGPVPGPEDGDRLAALLAGHHDDAMPVVVDFGDRVSIPFGLLLHAFGPTIRDHDMWFQNAMVFHASRNEKVDERLDMLESALLGDELNVNGLYWPTPRSDADEETIALIRLIAEDPDRHAKVRGLPRDRGFITRLRTLLAENRATGRITTGDAVYDGLLLALALPDESDLPPIGKMMVNAEVIGGLIHGKAKWVHRHLAAARQDGGFFRLDEAMRLLADVDLVAFDRGVKSLWRKKRKEEERIARMQAKAERKARRQAEKRAREAAARELVAVSHAATDPFGHYAMFRHGVRGVTIHVGPTNSGKTHAALEALVRAGSGAYLAPLRLLALETGERLRAMGHATNVVTGEERSLQHDAVFVSETVEMADLTRPYACAVVDEAQMTADPQRGGAWTRVLLGLDARELHVCCAPEALDLIQGLFAMCGDDVTVVHHARMTPLTVEPEPYGGTPEPGDAIVMFSRRDVLATAAAIEAQGTPTAVVYGALPWPARRAEAARFADWRAQVLVATDAIGMGLNLPIRRVVFGARRKYDGVSERRLTAGEIRQIAGRAGRRGMFDHGYVTSQTGSNDWLRAGLSGRLPPIQAARLPFPRELGANEDAPLSMILKAWERAPHRFDLLDREDLTAPRMFVDRLEHDPKLRLDRKTLLAVAFLPADPDKDMDHVMELAHGLGKPKHPLLPGCPAWAREWAVIPKDLWRMERDLRMLALRYAFARATGLMDDTMEELFAETRARWERAVIAKVAGPKADLIDRRVHTPRWDWDDDWDDDDWDDDDGYDTHRYPSPCGGADRTHTRHGYPRP